MEFILAFPGGLAKEQGESCETNGAKTRSQKYRDHMKSKQKVYVELYKEQLAALRAVSLSQQDLQYCSLDTTMLRAHAPTEKAQGLNVSKGQTDVAWFWQGEPDVAWVSPEDKEKLSQLTEDGNFFKHMIVYQ